MGTGGRNNKENAKKISPSARSPGAFAQLHRPPQMCQVFRGPRKGPAMAPSSPGEEAGEVAEKSLRCCPQVEVYQDHLVCRVGSWRPKQRTPPIWGCCLQTRGPWAHDPLCDQGPLSTSALPHGKDPASSVTTHKCPVTLHL